MGQGVGEVPPVVTAPAGVPAMGRGGGEEIRNGVLFSLRRIIRAVDLHSRQLALHHGLTGPQAILLSQIVQFGEMTGAALGKAVHLSKATVSGIVARLEDKGLVERVRSERDRRQLLIRPTAAARALLAKAPPLLQSDFVARFDRLPSPEKAAILAALERVAGLMDASGLEAGYLLTAENLTGEHPLLEEPPSAMGPRPHAGLLSTVACEH